MKKQLLHITLVIGLFASCNLKTSDEYFNDACQKEEKGDYKGAIKDLDIVLNKQPNDIEALINRGIDKKALNRFNDALNDLNKALSIEENNIMALYNRGNLFAEMKRYEAAIKDYDKAIKNKGGKYLYTEMSDNESLGIRSSDVQIEAIRLQRGISYTETKKYKSAYDDFSFCIKKKYGHDLAFLWRGTCLYNLGYTQEACKDWLEAEKLGMKEAEEYLNEYCKTKK